MQQIFQAANIVEASLIIGLLEQGSVQAFMNGYYLQGGVGELPASNNVSVWVDDKDVIQAQQLIADYRDQT
jgi:hypothetical protein